MGSKSPKMEHVRQKPMYDDLRRRKMGSQEQRDRVQKI